MSFTSLLARCDRTTLDLLGEPVTYAPSSGEPEDVTGIFDAAYAQIPAGEAGVHTTGPAVGFMLEDLPSDPETDDATITVTRTGTAYKIREAQPDGMGFVLLLLREA